MEEAGDSFGTVSWLRQLVASFSCWRPRFKPIPVHVGCIVEKVGLECVCLQVLWFSPVNVTPLVLHIHLFIHSSPTLQTWFWQSTVLLNSMLKKISFKCWYWSARLQGVTSQMPSVFIFIAARISVFLYLFIHFIVLWAVYRAGIAKSV